MDTDQVFESLALKILQQNPTADIDRIRHAYEFAKSAHEGQLRKDNGPYITHPLAAAEIIVDLGLDEDSIIATLLHDVIEDTSYTFEDIKQNFGLSVAEMVNGVTKLTKLQYTSKEDEQMENLRKMFIAMAKDIRVLLIKIADRLHNMRTMEYQSEKKRREKALETMEIYSPLAYRLGLLPIKVELEDMSLKYLDPVGYDEISRALDESDKAHEYFLDGIKERLGARLEELGIKATINSREKDIYSIYRKMYTQQKALDEIYDLYALRIIVDDIVECYNVLGVVHEMYKLIPGRFKDYISTPKPNMYQSLHTTVIGREGIPFEVQIRTWEMHHTAEYGIAAHWKYKQGIKESEAGFEEKLLWVRKLLESQEETDADEFIRNIKTDMFADDVYVFTPKGDVINLPAGATPIDFAYAIHSAVGNSMIGAKANGRIVTFDYHLQNGDIIEIQTTKANHGPSRDWLSITVTSEARNKIRQWFKREKREENIVQGREMLESQFKRMGFTPSQMLTDEVLTNVIKKMSYATMDDVYASIGYGGITAARAANRIRDEAVRLSKLHVPESDSAQQLEQQIKSIAAKKPTRSESGVIVDGVENCLIKFARCCLPLPGDDIVGFVTRGSGISIHRKDCNNAIEMKRSGDAGRWMKVSWADEPNDKYEVAVEISARDRTNLVVDILTAMSTNHISVISINARRLGDGFAVVYVTMELRDARQLKWVTTLMLRINSVMSVKRIGNEM